MLSEILDACSMDAEIRTDCKRKGVCAIVGGFYADNCKTIFSISAIGYNGQYGNVCSNEVGNCGCRHAEMNVIFNIIHNENIFLPERCVLLINYSPCTNCAHLIVSCKFIGEVIYRTLTEHDKRGVDILRSNGIKCYTIEEFQND